MSNINNVDANNFEQAVQSQAGLVLVDFYADWCGPCQAQTPILESFASKRGDQVTVVKVDVDAAPEVAGAYGVRSIPTLALFADGDVVDTRIGTSTEEQLNALVDKHLH